MRPSRAGSESGSDIELNVSQLLDSMPDVDLQTLIAVIRDKAEQPEWTRGQPDALPSYPSVQAVEESVFELHAELNRRLIQAMDLIAQHLQTMHTNFAVVEEWLREEAERSVQARQTVNEQIARLAAQLDEIQRKIGER